MYKLLFKICGILIVVFLIIISPWSAYAKEPLLDYLHTLAPPDSHAITAPSASVTLVTFEDYQCEACAHTNKILKELRQLYSGRLNFIFRHYPLTDQHPNALKAAVAVEAAAAQGKFVEMHDALLENQSEWANSPDPTRDFERYGRLFGPLTLPDPFDKAFEEYTKTIKRDAADAKKLDVKGVPTTFVNGRNVGYVSDIDAIRKEIEKDILPISIKFSPQTTGVKTGSITVTGETSIDKTAVDVTTKLPIKITYESEGKTHEQTIPNEPSTVCQGTSECSIPVPIDFTVTNTGGVSSGAINLPGDPSKWKITAYDPGGQEIAIYNGGVGSKDALWYWNRMVELRQEEEEENIFNPNNPQYAFVVIFFLLLFLAGWWGWHRK